MDRLLLLGLVVLSFSLLTACNTVSGTVHGAGQDIQSVTGPSHHVKHKQTAKSQKHTAKKKSSSDQKSMSESKKTTDSNSSY